MKSMYIEYQLMSSFLRKVFLVFSAEELHVEHCDDPVQPADRGGVGRALQGHLRVRIRLLEDSHFPVSRRRVSRTLFFFACSKYCFFGLGPKYLRFTK